MCREVRPEERKKAQAAFPDARAKLKGLRDTSGSTAAGGAKGVADIFSNTLEKKKKRSVSSAASGSLFGDDFVIPSAGAGAKAKADDSLHSLLLGQSGGKAKKSTDGGRGSSAKVGASVFGGEDDLFSSIVETRKSPRGARLSQSVEKQKKSSSPPKSAVSISGGAVPIVAPVETKAESESEEEEEEDVAVAVPEAVAVMSPPSSIYDEVVVPEASVSDSSAAAKVPAADDLFAGVGEEERAPSHLKSSLFASDEDTELFGKPSKEKSSSTPKDSSPLFAEPEEDASASPSVVQMDDASMVELFGKAPAKQVASSGLFDDPILADESGVTAEEVSGGAEGSTEEVEAGSTAEKRAVAPAPEEASLPDLSHIAAKDLVLWVAEFLPNVEVKEELGCSYGFVVDGCYFVVSSEAGALTVDLAWKEETEAADCVVTCAVEGLLRMAGGRLASPPASPEERLDCTKDSLLERLAACLDVDREQWVEFLDYKLQEAAEQAPTPPAEAPEAEAHNDDGEVATEIPEEAGVEQELLEAATFCKEVAFHGHGMSSTTAFFLTDVAMTLSFFIDDAALATALEDGEPKNADAVVTGESGVVLAVLQGTLPLAVAVMEGALRVKHFPEFLVFATTLTFSPRAYEEFRATPGATIKSPSVRSAAQKVVANAAVTKTTTATSKADDVVPEDDGATSEEVEDEAVAKEAAAVAERTAREEEARQIALAEKEAAKREATRLEAAEKEAEAAREADEAEVETADQRRAAAEKERLERERAEAERQRLEQEEKERAELELKAAQQRKFAEAQAEERRVKEEMARKEAEEKLRQEEEEKLLEEENKLRRLDPWYDIRKDNAMLVALVTARVPQCYQPNHGSGSFMFSVELQEARCSIVIDVEDDKVAVSPTIGSVRVPECALRCTSAVMQSVLKGETSVQVALMTGQVLAQTGLEKLAVFTTSFDFSLPVPELDLHPDFSLPTIQEQGAPIPAPARDSSMGQMPISATAAPATATAAAVATPAPVPPTEKATAPEAEAEAEASVGVTEEVGSGEPDPRLSHAFHFLLEAWKGCSFSGRVLICVTDDAIPNVVVSLTPSDVELLPAEEDEEEDYLCELRLQSEVLIDLVTGVRDVYQLQELGEAFLACKEHEAGALEKFCSVFDFSKSRYREFIIRKGLNPDDEFDSAGEDQRLQEAALYIPHCLQLSRVPKNAAKTLQLSLRPSDEDEEATELFVTINASRAKDGCDTPRTIFFRTLYSFPTSALSHTLSPLATPALSPYSRSWHTLGHS